MFDRFCLYCSSCILSFFYIMLKNARKRKTVLLKALPSNSLRYNVVTCELKLRSQVFAKKFTTFKSFDYHLYYKMTFEIVEWIDGKDELMTLVSQCWNLRLVPLDYITVSRNSAFKHSTYFQLCSISAVILWKWSYKHKVSLYLYSWFVMLP